MIRFSSKRFCGLLLLVSLQAVPPSVARAQQTISTSTAGPIYGNGSSIIVTTSGTIDGTTSGTGVISTGTNTTTTLTNAGVILATDNGIVNEATGSFGTITNSGTIQAYSPIISRGTLGSVTNTSTGRISGGNLGFLQRGGSVDQFSNAGMITSDGFGVGFDTGATLGTLTNSGTMRGADQGLILAATGTLTNLSAGLISGTTTDGLNTFGDVGLIDNAGSIFGVYRGVFIATGTVTDLTNTGSIDSDNAGVVMDADTTLRTLTNSGTIAGGGSGLVLSTTGTVTNNPGGAIRGNNVDGLGLGTIGNVGHIDNGGSIYGGDIGVYVAAGSVGGIDNAGTIEGGAAGLQIVAGTTLGTLINSGTIGGILNEGTIGTGVGPAIVSTGTGASIGPIMNTGTINQGFQIENQNVSVGAGGGVGVFDGGTLDVVDGNLTFTTGTITLGADVSVNGGSGTLVNQASLVVTETQAVTGNFQQHSGGTTLIDLLGVTPGIGFTITGSASFTGGAAGTEYTQNSGGLASFGSLELVGLTSTAPLTGVPVANRFIVDGNSATRQSTLAVGSGGLVLEGSNLLLQLGGTGALGSRLVLSGNVTTSGTTASSIAAPTGETNTVGTRAVELSGTAGVVTRTFTIGGGGANLTVSLPITNGLASMAGMTKAGAGTLTLNNANAYSGVTTINAGTLALSGSGSIGTGGLNLGTIESPGAFDLAALMSGTYFLPATGDLGGVGTLTGNGKTLAVLGSFLPGNSPGTVTVGNGVTLDLSQSGTSVFQITSPLYTPGTFDLVNGAGSVIFGGVLRLDFSGGTYPNGSDAVQIVTNAGGRFGDFASVVAVGLGEGQYATFNPVTGFLFIVPEPSTRCIAVAGIAFGGFSIWRRRKRV